MANSPDLARFLAAERRVEGLLASIGDSTPATRVAVRDVSVIPRFGEPEIAHADVTVAAGTITSIEHTSGPSKTAMIDGRDRWLVGGLVDAHVHTQMSARQDVLHLLHGVTGIREMCGFPWMMAVRDSVARGDRLAPRMMVAGHIIADHPLDGYATVVNTIDDALRNVSEQAEAGFDAIKVHNRLAEPLYDAVAAAARSHGLPLVGHVPHHLTVSKAIRAGQVTIEHLKGYYNDRDLAIAEDDWLGATRDSEVWNCPTLVTSREGSRGEDARHRLATEAASLVDPRFTSRWLETADDQRNQGLDMILERSRAIIEALAPVTDRWLAGTDAGGGIPFLVPGEALHEEMQLMENAGIRRDRVRHAATHAIADCHPEVGFPARVSPGEPADLVLLESDPRQNVEAYGRIAGLFAGGRWLGRDQLDALASGLRAIDEEALTEEEILDLVAETADMSPNHWHRVLAADVLGRPSSPPEPLPKQWP